MKEFLSKHAILYVDRDIAVDSAAMEELESLGYMTTPVIQIDGETVIGFNRKRLEELLGPFSGG